MIFIYNRKSNRYTFYQSTLDLFIKRYQHNLNENWGEESEVINSINFPFPLKRLKGKIC